MNWEVMDIGILGPAFLTGVVVLATHVPLGQRVLQRGIIFIDLAVAQLAGFGVIAAHTLGLGAHGVMVQIAAFVSAIAGALLLYWTERRWPHVQEAIIGSVFVLGATAAILLLAHDPLGGEHLKELLVGQILWVDYQSLGPPTLISLMVLTVWFAFKAYRSHALFYGLFAISVTVSVQLVGVYLVFASLIIPALAGRFLHDSVRLVSGYSIGIAGYGIGLVASALFDLPAGPVIVWTLAATAISTALFARPHKT
ncbi:MAG: metal ABC transporter permease [Pseudomonadota bacterium]